MKKCVCVCCVLCVACCVLCVECAVSCECVIVCFEVLFVFVMKKKSLTPYLRFFFFWVCPGFSFLLLDFGDWGGFVS